MEERTRNASRRKTINRTAWLICLAALTAAPAAAVKVQVDHDSTVDFSRYQHIIPRKHGGTDGAENLALARIDCNLHKGSNLAGIDPETNEVTELFHPRRRRWADHFEWAGIYVIGKTDVGRTTVRVMNINGDDQLALRSS